MCRPLSCSLLSIGTEPLIEPVAPLLFLVHRDPDLAVVIGIVDVRRGIDFQFRAAAVLVPGALGEELRDDLVVGVLEGLGHLSLAGEHRVGVGGDGHDLQVFVLHGSAVVLHANAIGESAAVQLGGEADSQQAFQLRLFGEIPDDAAHRAVFSAFSIASCIILGFIFLKATNSYVVGFS